MQHDEILVHISAPTTNQQDDIYRSLTAAYKDFKPHTSHGSYFALADDPSSPAARHNSAHEASVVQIPVTPFPQKPSTMKVMDYSTSKDSYGSFPSDISTGCHSKSHVSGSQDSLGVQPTSSRLAQLEKIHEKWKEGRTPAVSSSDGAARGVGSSLLERGEGDETMNENTFIEDTQAGVRALVSQIESEYEFGSTQEDTDGEKAIDLGRQVDGSSVGNAMRGVESKSAELRESRRADRFLSSQAQESFHVSSPYSETLPVGLPRHAATRIPDQELTAVTKLPPTLEPISSPTKHAANATSSTHEASSEVIPRSIPHISAPVPPDFTSLPTEVYPPPPQISVFRPGTLPSQITPHLAALQQQHPKRFKPSKVHGTLAHDDRGYWLIDCSTWPVKLQIRFWDDLVDHIGIGRLGWGVSLHRISGSKNSLGQVRVYCWAEILEHVWLELWVCSERWIWRENEKIGWLDGDGVIIVEM